jgi:hypothetical protein
LPAQRAFVTRASRVSGSQDVVDATERDADVLEGCGYHACASGEAVQAHLGVICSCVAKDNDEARVRVRSVVRL